MTESHPFYLPVRVYIEDTDAGGIVFYANYLKYFERARTEYVRSLGHELRRTMAHNINYVVHSVSLRYLQAARLDDQLRVYAQVSKLARTYLVFKQWVSDESGHTLVEGEVKVACVSLDSGKPRALPGEFVERLSLHAKKTA